jgi:hypothetical protein
MIPPRRRWFAFSLRTTFAIVAGIGLFLGWARWDHERSAERAEILTQLTDRDAIYSLVPDDGPALKQILWGFGIKRLELKKDRVSPNEIVRIRAGFPETELSFR